MPSNQAMNENSRDAEKQSININSLHLDLGISDLGIRQGPFSQTGAISQLGDAMLPEIT